MKYFCYACNNETTIRILPDYCSSHMWCDNCGCSVELSDLPYSIPESLQLLIWHWGILWDILRTEKTHLNTEHTEKIYNQTGNCIEEELSKQYECYFDSRYEAFNKTL